MQPFFSLLRGYHIISLFLSKQGCNSVLFPLAGILALTVTSSYYDMTEIATRILPNVAVLTIDPDRYLLCFVTLEIWKNYIYTLSRACHLHSSHWHFSHFSEHYTSRELIYTKVQYPLKMLIWFFLIFWRHELQILCISMYITLLCIRSKRFCCFSDVRTKAFQALDQFLSIARQNHEKVWIYNKQSCIVFLFYLWLKNVECYLGIMLLYGYSCLRMYSSSIVANNRSREQSWW